MVIKRYCDPERLELREISRWSRRLSPRERDILGSCAVEDCSGAEGEMGKVKAETQDPGSWVRKTVSPRRIGYDHARQMPAPHTRCNKFALAFVEDIPPRRQ